MELTKYNSTNWQAGQWYGDTRIPSLRLTGLFDHFMSLDASKVISCFEGIIGAPHFGQILVSAIGSPLFGVY
jgi:hypothetical protein